ncbi:MAG: hypothetical protein ACKOGA_18785 [Planctomycetaceae bacterium]
MSRLRASLTAPALRGPRTDRETRPAAGATQDLVTVRYSGMHQ